jgi:acyl carrier protein
MTGTKTAEELGDWIRDWLSTELKVPRSEINGGGTFVHYGVDSVLAMMLIGDLEDRLKRRLPPTLAWDYPTVEGLAAFLAAAPARAKQSDLISRLEDLPEEEIDRLLEEQRGLAARAHA